MSALTNQIEAARLKYDGSRPMEERCRKVLLGKSQIRELGLIAIEAGVGYVDFTLVGAARMEFRGLAVYPVDDASYCEVAL